MEAGSAEKTRAKYLWSTSRGSDSPGQPGAGDLPGASHTVGGLPSGRDSPDTFFPSGWCSTSWESSEGGVRRSGPVQISGSGSTANEAHSIARARRVARQSLVFLSVYFWGSVVREMHVVERAWIQGRAHKQPRRDRMSAWSSDVMHAALGSRGCGHVLSTPAWGRVGSVPGGGGRERGSITGETEQVGGFFLVFTAAAREARACHARRDCGLEPPGWRKCT